MQSDQGLFGCLTFATLLANSVDDKLVIFFIFAQETGFDIACKLSPLEAICMKCQILFSGKNKKNMSIFCLLKILPRMLSVKRTLHTVYIDQDKMLFSAIKYQYFLISP